MQKQVADSDEADQQVIIQPDDPEPKYDVIVPSRPDLVEVQVRKDTFQGWIHGGTHFKDQMAEAGFYYTGISDLVQCLYCGIGLRIWPSHSKPIPWIEHAFWSPHCPFVKQCRGQHFIDAVLNRSNPDKSPTLAVGDTGSEADTPPSHLVHSSPGPAAVTGRPKQGFTFPVNEQPRFASPGNLGLLTQTDRNCHNNLRPVREKGLAVKTRPHPTTQAHGRLPVLLVCLVLLPGMLHGHVSLSARVTSARDSWLQSKELMLVPHLVHSFSSVKVVSMGDSLLQSKELMSVPHLVRWRNSVHANEACVTNI